MLQRIRQQPPNNRTLEIALLKDLLVALDLIANSEISPTLEANTTLGILAHLSNVLLDILEGVHRA